MLGLWVDFKIKQKNSFQENEQGLQEIKWPEMPETVLAGTNLKQRKIKKKIWDALDIDA